MKAEKDKKTGKWLIQYRYTDWQGKRRKSTKRGFATKREAEEWLRNFLITIRVSKDTLTFIDFCLYLENLTRIDFRIGYLENLQNASSVFFILIMPSLFWRHNEPSYFHNPIAF